MTYKWKRLWVPRGGTPSFDSNGFLLPPVDATGLTSWYSKTDAVTFDKINNKPCLVLLGEPGIGKSFALRDAELAARTAGHESGVKFLYRNLGNYGSDYLLVSDIFDSGEFQWWKDGGGELHVFLDSFDECLFRIDSLATLLADQFARLEHTRSLFLRITSRTAEWRSSLEDALRRKWDEKSVGIYELAPLTYEQVFVAAETQNIDAKKFINAVVVNEVVPFVIKPLTLDLLFRIWLKQGQALPPTQKEIYKQGCLELCTESLERQTPKLRRKFTSEERFAIASHIAAVTIFCRRHAIFTGSRSVTPESNIELSELIQGSVTLNQRQLPITELALRETLDTGLFTARGREQMGWAHQTYAEFLAAHYLKMEGLETKQILDLITHPHDKEHKLVPQLQETAAWIAGVNRKIFDHLAKVQPDILLRSDVATADNGTKALLIDSLLTYVGHDFVHSDWWQMRGRYPKLKHNDIAKQLRRYLHNGSLAEDTRVEALIIAEKCEVQELSADCIRLALDPKEVHKIREFAGVCANQTVDEATKAKLKPLALGQCGIDENNALRGIGLTACWPRYMTAKELFDSIPASNELQTHHLYSNFLDEKLVARLKMQDFPIALAWAEKQSGYPRHEKFSIIASEILLKAQELLYNETIRTAYSHALVIRFRGHNYEGVHALNERLDKNQRFELIKSMVSFFQDDGKMDSIAMARFGCKLVTAEDLPWLVDQLKIVKTTEIKRHFCHLIWTVFYPDVSNKVDLIIDAAQEHPILAEVMNFWLKTSELESEAASKARHFYLEQKRFTEEAERRKRPQPLSPAPADQIVSLLDQFESGRIDAWWQITLWMERKDDGYHAEKHYCMDLREFPFWKNASANVKARLISVAYKYIHDGDPNLKAWFHKKNIHYHPARAGFRALLLLANEAPNLIATIQKEAWCKWCPVILQLHYYDEVAAHRLLTEKLFENAPEEAINWFLRIIDKENKEGDVIWILQKLPDNKWNDLIGNAILQRLKLGKLRPACTNALLISSFEREVKGALEFTRSLIPRVAPKSENRYQITLFASRLLMLHGEHSDWQKVRHIILKSSKFGHDLFEGSSHGDSHVPSRILTALSAQDVAELWEWMLAEYPLATDPNMKQSGIVTSRKSMAYLRNNLISHLANMGTPAACQELEKLAQKWPQSDVLRWQLSRAREQMRRNSWQPPVPNMIFALAEKRNRRLVQSAGQLMQVVIEALGRFQQKLQGKSPLADLLWSDGRPKPEKALSDWLEDFLNDDLKGQGIIIGREVQIHRLDRLDLRIDAISQENTNAVYSTVQVIVEVKGCWNKELTTAMEKQLVNRYLDKNDCRHGLYVVGWFLCDAWTGKNPNRKQVKISKLVELNRLLEGQAETLSIQGKKIVQIVLDATIPLNNSKTKTKGK